LELYDKIKRAKEFGVDGEFSPSVNLKTLFERKNKVIEIQKRGLQNLLKESKVKVISDEAELISPKTVILKQTREKIELDKVVLATGSRPAELAYLRFDGEKILSSDDLWKLKEIPTSIIIVGAGAIGCEFAWIFHLLGSKTTLIELMPKVLPMEDEEVSSAVERLFRKRKIDFFTGVKIEDLIYEEDSLKIVLTNGKILTADCILVSVGRAF
ncbi:MAG: FAD-dependent oxidoreductase, partial [Thermodesulfovibrio sp.]|nr:FAD-dependent oxidoreductase [Thermodesulfovibrio sp.]